jgi:hypothetical protein
MKLKLQQEEKRTTDSLQKAKDNIEKQLEKIESNKTAAAPVSQLQSYSLLVNID